MLRTPLLPLCTVLFATASCGARDESAPGESAAPQAVVLITLDTTRADRIGCYGNENIETPVLDELAAGGVLFERASTVSPVTLPSHVSILTGRYPVGHGVRNNGMFVLPEAERTLAEAFRDSGYTTAAFVGAFPLASEFGLAQGFQVYDENLRPTTAKGDLKLSGYQERSAADVNAAAIPWIEDQIGRSFFLWVHYFDPHAPYEPPPPFDERYAADLYDGEIAFVDSQIGELLAAVGRVAEPGNTTVAVVGDHGESLGEHGEQFHGIFVYESTISSPFVLWAPERLPAGTRFAEPVSVVDTLPTLLALSGLPAEDRPGFPLHGVDLCAQVDGRAARPGDAPILLESHLPRLEFGWSELLGIRVGSWKYVAAPRPELYDLATDPGEVINRLDGEPAREDLERARALAAQLEEALERMSSGGTGAERREMDAETIEKLRALGYLQGPAGAPGGDSLDDPKDMMVLNERINDLGVLLRKGDLDRALAACRSLLDEHPKTPRVLWWYGTVLLIVGDHETLDETLAPLVGEDPAFYWAPGLLAQSHEQRGNTDRALALYRRALATDPDYVTNALPIAELLRRLGRSEEALEQADAILARVHDQRRALEIAAALERELGRPDRAARHVETMLEATPDGVDLLSSAARLFFDAGTPALARPHLLRLLDLQPESTTANRLLGALAVMEGRSGEALPLLQTAIRKAPQDTETQYWLGIALVELGEYAEAEKRILPLVRFRPGSASGHRALGMLRRAQGRPEAAAQAFRRALELEPGEPFATEALRELERGS